jgi:hypothetical protein
VSALLAEVLEILAPADRVRARVLAQQPATTNNAANANANRSARRCRRANLRSRYLADGEQASTGRSSR